MSDLAATDREVVDRARALEKQFVAGCQGIRTAWIVLAEIAYLMHEDRAWELLGYETLEDFLGSPEVDMGRAHFFRLVQVHRELVVRGGIEPKLLEGIDVQKVVTVLPAIREGEVSKVEGIADARELSRSDLSAKYTEGGSPNGALAAEDEPELCKCETCGRVHRSAA